MKENDCVLIDQLEVPCRIGTTDEERAFPQLIWISIRAFLPLSKAGQSDDLSHSVDYALIASDVRRAISGRTFNLVESVAESTAAITMNVSKIEGVFVRVEKKIIPGTRCVGVEIWRSRSENK